MFCRKCGTEYEGNFCPSCGTPSLPNDSKSNSFENESFNYSAFSNKKIEKNNFAGSNGFVIFMLILFFPIGLFLMWKYSKWNKVSKLIVTAIFIAIIIGMYNSGLSEISDTQIPVSDIDSSDKSDSIAADDNQGIEDAKAALIKFDEQTWEDFKILYASHNGFMNTITAYSNGQIDSLSFYDNCVEAKDYFAKASLSFDYGTNDDETTYLEAFQVVALSDQQAAEQLIKYIDSGKASQLSKANEEIQRAKEAFTTIAENRGLLLVKAGLSDKEIKKKVEADMAGLETTK